MIASAVKHLPQIKFHTGPDGFPAEFSPSFKEESVPLLSTQTLSQMEQERMLPNSAYEASITLIPKPKTAYVKN